MCPGRNLLSLNIKKSKYTGSKIDNLSVQIDGETRSRVQKIKHLGLHITETISWKEHIDEVKKRVRPVTGVLARVRNCTSQKIQKLIYNAYIHPHLTYLNSLWGGAPQIHISSLQRP